MKSEALSSMQTINSGPKEFEEKTVERAVKLACEFFGCEEGDLEIEIITRGSTGLFGIGGKKAKIKAFPRNGITEEPSENELSGELLEETEDESPEERGVNGKVGAPLSEETDEETDLEKVEGLARKACEFLNGVLKASGLSGHAEVISQGKKPFLNIAGDDLSLIIGKDGQTLDALEYLVNLYLKRKMPDVSTRIVVEATGYRDRRRKSLIALAERLAIKARRTGRAVSLQPMPSKERRIVHLALKDFKGVRTHSSGDGHQRKVIITPLKRRKNNRRGG